VESVQGAVWLMAVIPQDETCIGVGGLGDRLHIIALVASFSSVKSIAWDAGLDCRYHSGNALKDRN
jgi:hypothetical protein